MQILDNKSELQHFLKDIKKKGSKISLIPTMGSIHKGHLSLIKASLDLGYFSIVTIFINPTQFDNPNDFKNYPNNYNYDKKSLQTVNCDLLFLPSTKDLYPNGIKRNKTIKEFRNILCDVSRPGHFDGVTTVVNSLFNLIKPEHVFFGEKDFQQLKIVESLIKKNNFSIVMHSCPSIRMYNGMSYSSRYKNFTLNEKDIFSIASKLIIKSISELRKNFNKKIIFDINFNLRKIGIKKIDYIDIRDESNLIHSNKNNNARLFIAFYIGKIRIIDNFILY